MHLTLQLGGTVPPTTLIVHSREIIKIWRGTLKIDVDGDGKQGIN